MADISQHVIPNAMFALHAQTVPDLEQWSLEELYEWADDKSQYLARRFGLFVQHVPATDPTMQYGVKQSLFPLPADHLNTVRLGTPTALLWPSTEREMRAGDDDWEETTGPVPVRWCGDALHEGYLTLYPIPLQAGSVDLIYQQAQPTVSYLPAPDEFDPAGNPVYVAVSALPQLSDVLADTITISIIAHARAVETDAQMPEAVTFASGLQQLYEGVIEAYYGGGL